MASSLNRREFMRQSTLLGVSGLLLPHRVWGAQEAFPIAQTTFGKVRGMDVSGIKTFRGIRYAASTAGSNRFMPPRKPRHAVPLIFWRSGGGLTPQRKLTPWPRTIPITVPR